MVTSFRWLSYGTDMVSGQFPVTVFQDWRCSLAISVLISPDCRRSSAVFPWLGVHTRSTRFDPAMVISPLQHIMEMWPRLTAVNNCKTDVSSKWLTLLEQIKSVSAQTAVPAFISELKLALDHWQSHSIHQSLGYPVTSHTKALLSTLQLQHATDFRHSSLEQLTSTGVVLLHIKGWSWQRLAGCQSVKAKVKLVLRGVYNGKMKSEWHWWHNNFSWLTLWQPYDVISWHVSGTF